MELIEGKDPHLAVKLRRRFSEARQAGGSHPPAAVSRTVGQLREAAAQLTEKRRQATAKRKAEERARDETAAAAARAKHVAALAARQPAAWNDVDRLIASKLPKSYDEAVALLRDLHDVAAQEGTIDRFTGHLARLREQHAKKASLMARMKKAGLGGAT